MDFSGKVQTLRFTEPQELTLDGIMIQAPLLYAPGAPVNLLGRDTLCKLSAQIRREATGIWVTFPKTRAIQYVVMHKVGRTLQELDKVYWLEIPDLHQAEVWKKYQEWRPWLQYMRSQCTEADMPLHCTIKYDKGGHDREYAQLWEEMEQGHRMEIKTQDVICGPQGVAAMVKLPDKIMNWYQEKEAALRKGLGQEI